MEAWTEMGAAASSLGERVLSGGWLTLAVML